MLKIQTYFVVVTKTFDFNKETSQLFFKCRVIPGHIFNCKVSSRKFM